MSFDPGSRSEGRRSEVLFFVDIFIFPRFNWDTLTSTSNVLQMWKLAWNLFCLVRNLITITCKVVMVHSKL
jgi:hypothetical protein